jgi:hypothetical protein
MIVPAGVKLVADGMAKSDKFKLTSGPAGTWLIPIPQPGMTIDFSGEVIDACTCFWGQIDVDVDVTVKINYVMVQ